MNILRLRLLVVAALAVLATSASSVAQPADSTRAGTRVVGFYLGASASHFTSKSGSLWNTRYGPDLGAAVTMNLTDLLALQTELAYKSKGAKWAELRYPRGELYRSAGDFRLGYVQLAVLARANQPLSRYRDEDDFRPKLLAGFALNFKVSQSSGGVPPPDFNNTDLSFIFGGGFDQRIAGSRSFTADFRFDIGMNKVYLDWRNNTARFLVGFTL